MPTSTYEQIAHTVLGSPANTVTFSSIPNTFTDLVLVVEHQTSVSETSLRVRFNQSASGYSGQVMDTNGVTVYSGAPSGSEIGFNWAVGPVSTSAKGIAQLEIFDYAKTDVYKVAIGRNGQTSRQSAYTCYSWNSTSAINRLDVYLASTRNFVSGSTFTLWGIEA